jgi:hypothetical protein
MSLLRSACLLACLPLLATCWLAPLAHADGDPASDVLIDSPLYLPVDLAKTNRAGALQDQLLRAQDQGHRVNVAVIATPVDLGVVGGLWKQPQKYADFLQSELTAGTKAPLVVVMPSGIGVAAAPPKTARRVKREVELPARPSGADLLEAASQAAELIAPGSKADNQATSGTFLLALAGAVGGIVGAGVLLVLLTVRRRRRLQVGEGATADGESTDAGGKG